MGIEDTRRPRLASVCSSTDDDDDDDVIMEIFLRYLYIYLAGIAKSV
jgi:hypothetical protein